MGGVDFMCPVLESRRSEGMKDSEQENARGCRIEGIRMDAVNQGVPQAAPGWISVVSEGTWNERADSRRCKVLKKHVNLDSFGEGQCSG